MRALTCPNALHRPTRSMMRLARATSRRRDFSVSTISSVPVPGRRTAPALHALYPTSFSFDAAEVAEQLADHLENAGYLALGVQQWQQRGDRTERRSDELSEGTQVERHDSHALDPRKQSTECRQLGEFADLFLRGMGRAAVSPVAFDPPALLRDARAVSRQCPLLVAKKLLGEHEQ